MACQTVTVYRLEREDGSGVYMSGDFYVTGDNCSTWERPAPAVEDWPFPGHRIYELMSSCEYKFAFPTLEALLKWFSAEDVKKLAAIGCHLYEYEVYEHHTPRSGKQCLFKIASARRLCKKELP